MRSHVGVVGSLRVLSTILVELPVHVPAVSPRELTRVRRAGARDTVGGPGQYPKIGHGEINMQNVINVVAFVTAVVDAAAFFSVGKQ